jgi:hypothetical protein
MQSSELGRNFLARVSDCLVSLPFDFKVLHEAVAEPELERSVRKAAAGVLIHALTPQDGPSPERFVDDVIWLRMALGQILAQVEQGSQPAADFCRRFDDIFASVASDLKLFETYLGPPLWGWLIGRLSPPPRTLLRGKRADDYVDDEKSWDGLYEDGLDFQTNYDVTDERVQNRLRRPEQVSEHLQRRFAEDSRKR